MEYFERNKVKVKLAEPVLRATFETSGSKVRNETPQVAASDPTYFFQNMEWSGI